MSDRIDASFVLNKLVISNKGRKLGEVADLIFDVKSGEILHIILKNATEYADRVNLERTREGYYLVPFSAVVSIGDFVIISEEELI